MMKISDKMALKPVASQVDVRERLIKMDRRLLSAVLATASDEGPYTSLMAFALTPDAKGIVLATTKGQKYRNILKNKAVSLLMDTRANTRRDYAIAEAITIQGTARPLRKGKRRDEMGRSFMAKHPKLRRFVQSPDTVLVHVAITRCIHVSRFQAVAEWRPD